MMNIYGDVEAFRQRVGIFFAYFSLLSKPLFYFNGRFGALNLAVQSPRHLREIWPVRIEWRHWLVAAMSGSGVIDRQSLLARFEKMRNLERKNLEISDNPGHNIMAVFLPSHLCQCLLNEHSC